MDVKRLLATHPGDGRYADMIGEAFSSAAASRLQAAVAYATQGGVAELCGVLGGNARWQSAQKQWLVGIDYCRSDPLALVSLQDLPRSEVRIHDGAFVVQRVGCTPRVSYHPKLYVFTGATGIASVVGSGNLSYTGLRRGVEAAAAVWSTDIGALKSVGQWYKSLWNAATPLADVQAAYADRYLAFSNRQNPVPVEDDAAPANAGVRGQLTPIQLRQLRVCPNLWIEAGNLHLNRGPNRPGNQLMLKRNTRVFFGFQAVELTPDTAIGSVAIRCLNGERPVCPLRFSNNSMDVLTLPIPGEEGPLHYDGKALLFRRIGVRRFELSVASGGQLTKWRSLSESLGASFTMASGRRWGVF